MDKLKLSYIFQKLYEEIILLNQIDSRVKKVCLSILTSLIGKYRKLEPPSRSGELYKALQNQGSELISQFSDASEIKGMLIKTRAYLRYAEAAIYDFHGNMKGLRLYTFSLLVTASLFLMLSPRFYGFMLPLLFVIPIFIGLRGIEKRSRTGLMVTLAIIPAALFTGITWIKYYFDIARPAFYETVAVSALRWGVTFTAARWMIVAPTILGALLIFLSSVTAYWGIKYRHMFV